MLEKQLCQLQKKNASVTHSQWREACIQAPKVADQRTENFSMLRRDALEHSTTPSNHLSVQADARKFPRVSETPLMSATEKLCNAPPPKSKTSGTPFAKSEAKIDVHVLTSNSKYVAPHGFKKLRAQLQEHSRIGDTPLPSKNHGFPCETPVKGSTQTGVQTSLKKMGKGPQKAQRKWVMKSAPTTSRTEGHSVQKTPSWRGSSSSSCSKNERPVATSSISRGSCKSSPCHGKMQTGVQIPPPQSISKVACKTHVGFIMSRQVLADNAKTWERRHHATSHLANGHQQKHRHWEGGHCLRRGASTVSRAGRPPHTPKHQFSDFSTSQKNHNPRNSWWAHDSASTWHDSSWYSKPKPLCQKPQSKPTTAKPQSRKAHWVRVIPKTGTMVHTTLGTPDNGPITCEPCMVGPDQKGVPLSHGPDACLIEGPSQSSRPPSPTCENKGKQVNRPTLGTRANHPSISEPCMVCLEQMGVELFHGPDSCWFREPKRPRPSEPCIDCLEQKGLTLFHDPASCWCRPTSRNRPAPRLPNRPLRLTSKRGDGQEEVHPQEQHLPVGRPDSKQAPSPGGWEGH